MEERRFDELTRTLGQATSRRGLLKGLLGGVIAALAGRTIGAQRVAAAGCSVANCKEAALRQMFFYQQTTCSRLCYHPRLQLACLSCQLNSNSLYQQWLKDCENGDGCLSVAGEVCCGGQCAFVGSDPNNCGSCGHTCEPGSVCQTGECQCADPKTNCDGHCVDTQSDQENCGACGNACTGCELCSLGECVSICTDDAPCCNGQCVSNQCDAPEVFDPDSCSCVCPPANQCGASCCTEGQECCNGQCYTPCLDGEPRDSTTCECGCSNGQLCGAECCSYTDDCCNGQCLAGCPASQKRDPSSCQCVCETGEVCGPFCCSEDKVCCPDTLTGMSCRDPDPVCPGCQQSCGDICCGQYEYCCRAADYSYHCVASSGDTC